MKVDFQVRRSHAPFPATALLLTTRNAEGLLRLYAALGCKPLPPAFSVAGGFLVKLPEPPTRCIAGVIRLRALAENLLLPADGVLVPTLLADEARILTRRHGLIFLAGGQVLEFMPDEPVPLSELLRVTNIRRRIWEQLPSVPSLPDRIEEIKLDLPQPPAEQILDSGGKEIGTEDPWSGENPSLAAKLAGKPVFTFGVMLAWLGSSLGLKGVARLGSQLMSGAMNLVPRLSESLLGAQDATLRALLRQFREGDPEAALRRALPIGGATRRGSQLAGNAELPFHNLFYSLQKLLGGAAGPSSLWLGHHDVMIELAKEYRRLAQAATQCGDFRRAAFIYAKLLGDYRIAALVLERGGLYRDAAIIYSELVGDSEAAAKAYEAGGMIDEALAIYRQRGEHELAGDLLRRAGEEEQALAEYDLAAKKIIASGGGYYRAGELMLTKAGRADLAQPYYQEGWRSRPAESPVSCAVRLVQRHAQTASSKELLNLVLEAEEYVRPPGRESETAEFFNEVVRLADVPGLPDLRSELRDRSLTAIAGKIRQRVENRTANQTLVSSLMGSTLVWPSAVTSDAEFALRAQLKVQDRNLPTRASGAWTVIQARIQIVTALCHATDSGDVFLGFASGEVVCFRPQRGQIIPLVTNSRAKSVIVDKFIGPAQLPVPQDDAGPVVALAADSSGDHVVVVWKQDETTTSQISSYSKQSDSSFARAAVRDVPSPASPWGTQCISHGGRVMVGLCNGEAVEWTQTPLLIPTATVHLEDYIPATLVGGLLSPPYDDGSALTAGALLIGADQVWYLSNVLRRRVNRIEAWLGWTPALPEASTLKTPGFSYLWNSPGEVELAGVSASGAIYWCSLSFDERFIGIKARNATKGDHHYLACTIIRPGLIAAVTPTGIEWLRSGANHFSRQGIANIAVPNAVACFAYHRMKELIVVCADGSIGIVPMTT
jgi:tetratricopeptide (TPR) repeat protein